MATYIILSRFSPEAFDDPKKFKELAAEVSAKVKKQCPEVTWKSSFATLGRFDVVDLVEAEDPKADREGRDDHTGVWAFDDGNTGRDTMEGVSGYAVKPHGLRWGRRILLVGGRQFRQSLRASILALMGFK